MEIKPQIKLFKCPDHPGEPIKRITNDFTEKKLLYCIECVINSDKLNNTLDSYEKFIENLYLDLIPKAPIRFECPPSPEFLTLANDEEAILEHFSNHISSEKARIMEDLDIIGKEVLIKIEGAKERLGKELDKQLQEFKKNLKRYKRKLRKHFVYEEKQPSAKQSKEVSPKNSTHELDESKKEQVGDTTNPEKPKTAEKEQNNSNNENRSEKPVNAEQKTADVEQKADAEQKAPEGNEADQTKKEHSVEEDIDEKDSDDEHINQMTFEEFYNGITNIREINALEEKFREFHSQVERIKAKEPQLGDNPQEVIEAELKNFRDFLMDDLENPPAGSACKSQNCVNFSNLFHNLTGEFLKFASKISYQITPYRKIDPIFESELLTNNEMEELKSWLTTRKMFSAKILYRSSKEGFKLSNFRHIWLDHQNVLIVIKIKKGIEEEIIGSFRNRARNINISEIFIQAFSFNLTHANRIIEGIVAPSLEEINDSGLKVSNYITISEDSNINEDSFHSDFSKEDGNKQASSKLNNFLVIDFEILQVDYPGIELEERLEYSNIPEVPNLFSE